VGEWNFRYQPGVAPQQFRSLVISKSVLDRQQPVTIQFLVAGAKSPKELGINPDSRKLGLGVMKMRFVACTDQNCRAANTDSGQAAVAK